MAKDVSHEILHKGKSDTHFLEYEIVRDLFESEKLAETIAREYAVPLKRVEMLAQDPDHGGNATVSSYIETMVALELEKDGILGVRVTRGPSMTDLKDGWQRQWDVKAPPKIEGREFDFEAAIDSIKRKFSEFPEGNIGIFLCVSFMNKDIYYKLQKQLQTSLSENERFRVRQVEIEGAAGSRHTALPDELVTQRVTQAG